MILNIIIPVLIFFILVFIFRKQLINQLLKLKNKLTFQSLRIAIDNADKNKKETGRKNIVVYNTTTKEFEPMQKKVLKTVANSRKNKNNAAQTKGRVKFGSKRAGRLIGHDRIKQTEKHSLYVTN